MLYIGRIIFKDKKFRGFRGYLVNLENKYPHNFLYIRLDFFSTLGGEFKMALWKYFKREVKTPLLSHTGSLSSAISSGGIVATNKEVQRVMDTSLMMGYYLRGGCMSTLMMRKGHKLVDTLLITK